MTQEKLSSQRHHYREALKKAKKYEIIKDSETVYDILPKLHYLRPPDQRKRRGYFEHGAYFIAAEALADHDEFIKTLSYSGPTRRIFIFPHPLLILGSLSIRSTASALLVLSERAAMATAAIPYIYNGEIQIHNLTITPSLPHGPLFEAGLLSFLSNQSNNVNCQGTKIPVEQMSINYSIPNQAGKFKPHLQHFYRFVGSNTQFKEAMQVSKKLRLGYPKDFGIQMVSSALECVSAIGAGLINDPSSYDPIFSWLSSNKMDIPRYIEKNANKDIALRVGCLIAGLSNLQDVDAWPRIAMRDAFYASLDILQNYRTAPLAIAPSLPNNTGHTAISRSGSLFGSFEPNRELKKEEKIFSLPQSEKEPDIHDPVKVTIIPRAKTISDTMANIKSMGIEANYAE